MRGTMRRNPQEFILFQSHDTFVVQRGLLLNSRLSGDKSPLATLSRNNKYPKHRKLLKFIIKITERPLQRFQVPNPIKDWAGAGFRIRVVHPNSPQNKRIQKAVHCN